MEDTTGTTAEAIRVLPWPDPVLDVIGHDPRSWYAETFWLPTLGPTALLLMRHLADRFEQTPAGVELPVADTSAALGLGPRNGPSSPLVRSLHRLGLFELACNDGSVDHRGASRLRRFTVATCAGSPSRSRRATPNGSPTRRTPSTSQRAAGPADSAHPPRPERTDRHRRARISHGRLSIPGSRTKPCGRRANKRAAMHDDDDALLEPVPAPVPRR